MQITIWYPTGRTAAGSPAVGSPEAAGAASSPVVLLAPGDAGSGTRFTYLAEHLASWGYVVVSVAGTGATVGNASLRFEQIWKGFSTSHDTAVQRLVAGSRTRKIALIAASSAAASAFEEAGGFDTGAIVVLGAYPAAIGGAVGSRVPALIMFSGKEKRGGDPVAVRRMFEGAGPDVRPYLVYFPDGVRDSFADTCLADCSPVFTQQRAHELVARYVMAFLQTYIGGDTRYARDLGGSTTEEAEEADDPPDAIITRIGS